MRVTILDYGAGNLHSLEKAVSTNGADVAIVSDPRRALDTDVFVLPGVGAFAGAAECLAPVREPLRQALEGGLPCLAICLGMQLLFDTSEEGPGEGLGLMGGPVQRVVAPIVPHMGWNTLEEVTDDAATASGLSTGYYAHSFVCRPERPGIVTAWTTAGSDRFPAIVRYRNTVGVQFHPEKSSAPGLRFLQSVFTQFVRPRVTR
jgi:imidazole glycerol-phosphate synthase subunit HisH